jgi:uncharacterized repeat protein (TIGR01451 family)
LITDQRGATRVGRCDIGAYEYTIPGPPASIHAFGGTPQHTPPFFDFGTSLQALVLDSIGSPVYSATVTFSAPTSGASGTFADTGSFTTTAVTNESGVVAAATFTANGLTGSYTVTATVGGVVTPANFLLSNLGWYVSPSGNDGNDCQSPATPCATINGALGKANFLTGDTVLVAVGTYTGSSDEVVLLDKSLRLFGGWDGTFTTQSGTSTIDGEDVRRGITVNGGVTAIVERFAVQNGSAGSGGGITNSGILTLTNSTVSGNSATDGWPDGGGGGIRNYNGTVTLNNSTVSGNTAYFGGGIRNSGVLTLNNSTVSGNTVNGGGGGIYNYGTLTLNNSTVSGNTARQGGGIYKSGGTLTLNNSTVSGNSAGRGGGIYNLGGGPVTLQNAVLASNMASGTGPDCVGPIGSAGYNLIGNTSDCTFSPGTDDLIDVNANLGQLIGASGVPRYHPLLSGSPAIDAGNPAGCTDDLGNPLPTDQRGAARVGRCDIGAYEYTTPGPAASVAAIGGTPQHTPPFFDFWTPLQAAVLDSIGSPVNNATTTFSAPVSGASGMFADSGTFTTTAVTTESGVATAATFTANGLTGSYTATATVSGVVTPANFLLSNVGWYVAPGGSDGYDCQSPATPCATVNGALGKADFLAGGTVLVATGTYTGTGDEVVLLDKGVRLFGGWDGTFTTQGGASTIDGEDARRGITVVYRGVTAIVERFTVQNGSAIWGDGGGIRNDGALALTNSTVSGNTGGIHNSGILTLNNSTVSGNTITSSCAGIYNLSWAILTLNNGTVSGNTASGTYSHGGGICNVSTLTLKNSNISGNTAEDEGGGIYNRGANATATLNNSTVSGNSAWHGGGIYNHWEGDPTLILNNSTVSGNWAIRAGGIYGLGNIILNSSTVSGNSTPFYGGGIYSVDDMALNNSTISGNTAGERGGGIYKPSSVGTITLNSSTISDNTAGSSGGGIYQHGTIGEIILQNTILADNMSDTGPDCLSEEGTSIGTLGYNLIGDTSGCIFSSGTGDLTNIDAKLGPLEGSPGYQPLLSGSPAINAGNPAGCMGSTGLLTTDQRGVARFGRCDIGAYEMQPIGFSTKTANEFTALPSDPLTYTIALTNGGATNITNVRVTDTLPISLTYSSNSLTATNGSYGYNSGVITWTGSVNASGAVTISFGATVSHTVLLGTSITNSAVISGGGEIITRTATVGVRSSIYLPVVLKNW